MVGAPAFAEDDDSGEEPKGDWFDPFVNFNSGVIVFIDEVIHGRLGITGTFGFAIIGYTLLLKLITFPLNQSSLRTTALMQLIQPKVTQIQQKYKDDEETKNRMMLRLYDDCGVNPIGGFLPALIQFPVFISLYRAVNKLAKSNDHFKESFLWIPSLAGPVEVDKPNMDWLLKSKFEDHFEPLVGWQQAGLYLILPILLIISQFITSKASSPTGPNAGGPAAIMQGIFPLFIGFTCMSSPSGLGLYWLTNNILTQAQTSYIRYQLGEEFPAYKKILDGTAAREAEEKKRALEDRELQEAEEFSANNKGFAAIKAGLAGKKVEPEPELEVAPPPPPPAAVTVELDPEAERRRAINQARRKVSRQRKR